MIREEVIAKLSDTMDHDNAMAMVDALLEADDEAHAKDIIALLREFNQKLAVQDAVIAGLKQIQVDDAHGKRQLILDIERQDAEIATLRALLEDSRRHHLHCDDSWYCCAKCDSSDHGPLDGHDGESPRQEGVCNCGADAWNARVDAAQKETR